MESNENLDTPTPDTEEDRQRIELLNKLAKKIEERFQKRVVARVSKEAEWRLIRNRFSGARAPARLPVRVRTQTG